MKFAFKLTSVIILLLSITLSVGGAYTISQNHSQALASAQNQNALLHLRERYFIEDALWRENDKTLTGAYNAINRHVTQQSAAFGISKFPLAVFNKSGTTVFSNMPRDISYNEQFAASQVDNSISYCKVGKKRYMLMSSPLQCAKQDLVLINAYEATAYFNERNRQLRQFFTLELAMLIIASTAAAILSQLLTKPLRELKSISNNMAMGNFEQRADIKASDEVGDLGNSFNAMANAVQGYINELKEESNRKSRFVAAFTHELKTPMTSIIGYADLMRSGEQDEQRHRQSVNYIYHEAKRLEQLSKKLLCLLSVENGNIELKSTPIKTVLADARRSCKDIQFDIVMPKNQRVLADRALLADLLCNLANNAINSHAKDNTVHIICKEINNEYILKVQDYGCGMKENEIAKITEPFYTIDKSRSRKTGGTGLGLAICEQIARAHGSDLHIESIYGQGTSVWLALQKGADDDNA